MRIATFAVTVLLCIGMTAPEVFGEPGSPPAAADDAALLGQLKARDPLLQEVRSGGSDSKLIGLFGDLADAQPNKPAVVQGFVTQYGTLLGFPAGGMPGDMQLQPEGQREKGVTLTYVPTKGGVSYKKGAVQFGFAPNGKLMTATGRFKSAAGADMGGLSAEDAAKKALTEMHAMYPGSWLGGAGKLIETLEDTDDGKGIRRVWRVVAALGDRRRPVRVRLGPGGEVLDKGSSAETASGKVYTSYPDSAMGDGDLPKLFVDSIPFLRGMWGHHFLADSSSPMYARVDSADRADYDPVSYTVPASGSTPARTWWDPRFLEVNVYHHLMIGHDKAIGWGMSEVDNQTVKFDVYYAGYDDNADYTHYDGVDHLRFARDNAPCDYRSPAQDMSVIYHEYGHYVQAALNPSRSAGGAWRTSANPLPSAKAGPTCSRTPSPARRPRASPGRPERRMLISSATPRTRRAARTTAACSRAGTAVHPSRRGARASATTRESCSRRCARACAASASGATATG